MKSAGAARRLVTGPRPAMVARPAAAAAKQLGVARPADGYVARATDTSIAPPRLGGDDHAPGAEPIDAVRQRELVRRLGMLARSLGKDFKLRLEPGSWWAYHFDANKITYPIADMMAHDDEYNLGVICHELSHRLYSRLPPTSRSDNKSFHFLWNAIEDIRINKIISTRYAGVEGYMKELYRDFAAPEKLDKPLPRAMQFGFAFIHEWATGSGERSPFASDPDVIAAMEAAQPYIDEATRLPPGVDLRFSDLTKEEADAEALHSFEVLRSRVWPIYQQLLEQDLADPATRDAAQELNEQQKQEEGAEGAQGAGESGEAGDPEETDGAQGAGGAGETGESEETDGAQGAGGAGETGESEETDGAQGAGGAGETGESEETDGAQGAGGAGETGESEETDGAQGAGGAGETGESEETDGAQGAGGAGETGESGETDGEPGAGGADTSSGASAQDAKQGKATSGKPSGDRSDAAPQPDGAEENPSFAEGGTLDTAQVPHDPLKDTRTDASVDAARKALDELFDRASRSLEGQIRRAEEAEPEESVDEAEANERKGTLEYQGDTSYSLDDQLKALDEQLRQREQAAAARTEYGRIRGRYQREIDQMVAEIGNALERDDLPQLRGHFRSGVYDLRRAIQSEFQRQATGRGDPKVFMRRDEPVERRTEIVFCVDISGSMRGDNIAAAREAVVVFQEALHELGLPYGVVAYNGRPLVLAELAVHQDDNREAPLGHLQANGDNNDTGALKVARDMLEGSDANNKVVFFLTDGAAVADTKSYVEQTEAETDIAVIGIGIGAGCGEVPNIYRSHLVVPNIAELARKIGELLGDVIVGNGG